MLVFEQKPPMEEGKGTRFAGVFRGTLYCWPAVRVVEPFNNRKNRGPTLPRFGCSLNQLGEKGRGGNCVETQRGV